MFVIIYGLRDTQLSIIHMIFQILDMGEGGRVSAITYSSRVVHCVQVLYRSNFSLLTQLLKILEFLPADMNFEF